MSPWSLSVSLSLSLAQSFLPCFLLALLADTLFTVLQVLKAKGKYDPKRLFGVTTLDVVRANTFVGEALGKDVNVTVVGGHAGTTILPLLSSVEGGEGLSDEKRDALTHRIMFGGDEVVQVQTSSSPRPHTCIHVYVNIILHI